MLIRLLLVDEALAPLVMFLTKFMLFKRFSAPLLFLPLLAAVAAEPHLEVYFIGNSLTRGLSKERLAWLFEQGGGRLDYGGQGAAGAILHEHWFKERDDGRTWRAENLESAPYGDYDAALSNHSFDALILQPYQYWLQTQPGDEGTNLLGDRETIGRFMEYAMGDNPQGNVATTTFYIYNTWPRLLGIHYRNPGATDDANDYQDSLTGYSFADFYAEPYEVTAFWDGPRRTVPTRDFVEQLMEGIRADFPDLGQPVRLIPVGEVLAVLDEMIRAGTLPGIEAHFTREDNAAYYLDARAGQNAFPAGLQETAFDAAYGVGNFYADRVHMNTQPHNGSQDGTIGAYVAALTMYTVLTGEKPVGLPVTDATGGWQRFDPIADAELVTALQEVVWEVVTNDPYTGLMTEDPTWAGYPVIDNDFVNTEGFLGWLALGAGDWVWSYALDGWMYLPEGNVGDGGAWVYMPR